MKEEKNEKIEKMEIDEVKEREIEEKLDYEIKLRKMEKVDERIVGNLMIIMYILNYYKEGLGILKEMINSGINIELVMGMVFMVFKL